jgi:hypothetical protein
MVDRRSVHECLERAVEGGGGVDDEMLAGGFSETHRGVFSDWRSIGPVWSVPLRLVRKPKLLLHMRERCPHCHAEVAVRKNTNYDKNRRSAIRAHLQRCPRWRCAAPLPRPRTLGKVMERHGRRSLQVHIDTWLRADGDHVALYASSADDELEVAHVDEPLCAAVSGGARGA